MKQAVEIGGETKQLQAVIVTEWRYNETFSSCECDRITTSAILPSEWLTLLLCFVSRLVVDDFQDKKEPLGPQEH